MWAARAHERLGGSAAPPIGTLPVLIDDFRTGPVTVTTSAPFKQIGQNGESMAGKSPCIQLDAPLNSHDRPTTISVADGHLFVEGGVGVGGAVTLLYGLDQQCANKPMGPAVEK